MDLDTYATVMHFKYILYVCTPISFILVNLRATVKPLLDSNLFAIKTVQLRHISDNSGFQKSMCN